MVQLINTTLSPLHPAVVYVFGSQAAGRASQESDVDLAILSPSPLTTAQVFRAGNDLAEVLSRDVDLIDLARASTVLRKEVLRTGRVIYENDPHRRQEFEMYALSDYARLNEERAPVLAALGHPLPADA